MSERYSSRVATHYHAYRPPLHALILAKLLNRAERFDIGLDIGCGTGYSTVALAAYCDRVVGIDPSRPMIERASPNPRVTYREGDGENIPCGANSVAVVTFAGSLFYTKTGALMTELNRVCRAAARIVAYDFEVMLGAVPMPVTIEQPHGTSDYDHTVNFTGTVGFETLRANTEQTNQEVSSTELAHILLANARRYQTLAEHYGTPEPFAALSRDLDEVGCTHHLPVTLYYSMYELHASTGC